MSPVLWTLSVLLVLLLILEDGGSIRPQDGNDSECARDNWSHVKALPHSQVRNKEECEFHCYVDEECDRWLFLASNHSCFLISDRLIIRIANDTASLSSFRNVFSGSKKLFRSNHVDRLISGPLALTKSSLVNFPRRFYRGCSYTVSMWFWLWNPTYWSDERVGDKEMVLFSTSYSLPFVSELDGILPALSFNVGKHKEKWFFSSDKDNAGDYVGDWGDEVKFEQWTHVALVISPKSFTPYINGRRVRQEVLMKPGLCPSKMLIDMSARTLDEVDMIREDLPSDIAINSSNGLPFNTIFHLGKSKASAPLLGLLKDVDVFTGKELTLRQIQYLYEHTRLNAESTLPSLSKIARSHREKASVSLFNILGNEYALISLYGALPQNRIYGAEICLNGVSVSPKYHDSTPNDKSPVAINVNSRDYNNESSDMANILKESNKFGSHGNLLQPHSYRKDDLPVRDIVVVHFHLGDYKFPFYYNAGDSSSVNCLKFCEDHWSALRNAFAAVDMKGIAKEECAKIVEELTKSQIDHALESVQYSPDLSPDHEIDADFENFKSYVRAIRDILNSEDDISEEIMLELEDHAIAIESAMESSTDAQRARMEELLDFVENPTYLHHSESGLSGANNGQEFKDSMKFEEILVGIEESFYSPEMDDETFIEFYDSSVEALREEYYYSDEMKDSTFEGHLNDLTNVVFSEDVDLPANMLQDAVDNLYDDFMYIEDLKNADLTDMTLNSDDETMESSHEDLSSDQQVLPIVSSNTTTLDNQTNKSVDNPLVKIVKLSDDDKKYIAHRKLSSELKNYLETYLRKRTRKVLHSHESQSKGSKEGLVTLGGRLNDVKGFLRSVMMGAADRASSVLHPLSTVVRPFLSHLSGIVNGTSDDIDNVNNTTNTSHGFEVDRIISHLVEKSVNASRSKSYLDSFHDDTSKQNATKLLNDTLTETFTVLVQVISESEGDENDILFAAMKLMDPLINTVIDTLEMDDFESDDFEADLSNDFAYETISKSVSHYDTAMALLEGNYNFESFYNESKSVNEAVVSEPSESFLIFSSWLSDVLEMEYPTLKGRKHAIESCGMLGQAPRMALGHKYYADKTTHLQLSHNQLKSSSKVLESLEPSEMRNAVDQLLCDIKELIGSESDVGSLHGLQKQASEEFETTQQNPTLLLTLLENNENFESDIYYLLHHLSRGNASTALTVPENPFYNVTIFTNDSTEASSSGGLYCDHNGLLGSKCAVEVEDESGARYEEAEEESCIVSASYYHPVMQYVLQNYDIPDNGIIAHPEVHRLSDFGPIGTGVTSAMKAALPKWLGVDGSYNLDSSEGVSSIEGWEGSATSSFLQVEAAEGNAEAQVWLGVKHYWGSSGFALNATAARIYFELAAAQDNGQALYCLGVMYENGQGGLPQNSTKAVELFTRAANLPSPHPTALQVLGLHFHRGPLKHRNVTQAKIYYEKSAALGDSSGYFSLGTLYREGYREAGMDNSSVKIERNIPLSLHFLALAAAQGDIHALSTLAHAFWDSESWLGHYHRLNQQTAFQENISSNQTSFVNSDDSSELLKLWSFNSSRPTVLSLPNGKAIEFPHPPRPSCSTALPLLKYVSDLSFRPNDLALEALDLFLLQDYAGALRLFDEASELGTEIAMLNSAFLYKSLLHASNSLFQEVCESLLGSNVSASHCRLHFEDRLMRRSVQLASLDNTEGFREIGDILSDASTRSLSKQHKVLAASFYGRSALKFRDITSLMSLANAFYAGHLGDDPALEKISHDLYWVAWRWEREDHSAKETDLSRSIHTYNDYGETSGGIAPAVAIMRIYANRAWAFFSSMFNLF